MKYYEMHESVYKKIKNDEKLSWDKAASFDEMWSHNTNVYLSKFLAKKSLSLKGLRVLDLGTGTGTSALYTAKEGAKTVAVEVSKTAIEIAKSNASKLGLNINFIEDDVLKFKINQKFSIVIDSTILHCIVGNPDRIRFYDCVKRHLDNDGFLFINTMISDSGTLKYFNEDYLHFENEVLWSLGFSEILERKVINSKSYFPHRTLLSKDNQLKEFSAAGFDVIELETTPSTEVQCLVGLLKLKR